MKNRMLYVSLNNIKSVKNGKLEFADNSIVESGDLNDYKSGILGIYGQNGSGKTTVYNCLSLLKTLSMQRPIYSFDDAGNRKNNMFSYLVNVCEGKGNIEYGFLVCYDNIPYKVVYSVDLSLVNVGKRKNVILTKESITVLNYYEKGERWKYPFAPQIIDFEEEGFKYLYDGIEHESDYTKVLKTTDAINLFAKKKNCSDLGLSFVFSKENINYLCNSSNGDVKTFGNVLNLLRIQLAFNMFLFSHDSSELSQVGFGSLLGACLDAGGELHGSFKISLNEFEIKESQLKYYEKFIKQINVFINAFVPGFASIVEKNGFSIVNGEKYLKIEIFRKIDDNNQIPLREESAGIRKLFFISCALIYIYGNKDGWLIVDELDSGVFEDLLGQILQAISNSGCGQLFFTAHNLVPLERLPSNCVAFTTFNPNNRFTTIKGLTKTNNLRDVYLRTIRIGGQSEKLSSDVETYDIENALFNAYKVYQNFERAKND